MRKAKFFLLALRLSNMKGWNKKQCHFGSTTTNDQIIIIPLYYFFLVVLLYFTGKDKRKKDMPTQCKARNVNSFSFQNDKCGNFKAGKNIFLSLNPNEQKSEAVSNLMVGTTVSVVKGAYSHPLQFSSPPQKHGISRYSGLSRERGLY